MKKITLFAVRYLCLLFCAMQFGTAHLSAQASGYTPLTPDQYTTLMHSKMRFVQPLAGEWQRTAATEQDWQRITLPYSETAQGEFRYRRTFVIDDVLIKRYEWQIHLLGCNYRTELYINGQYLFSHVGGTVPFQVRIPDSYLANGNNTLELVVNNQMDASSTVPLRSTPHEAQSFGGVTRELFLVGTPDISLGSVDVKTLFPNNDLNTASTQITAALISGNLYQFTRQDSTQVAQITSIQKANVEVSAELRLVGDSTTVVARATPTVLEVQANRNAQVKLNFIVSAPRLWSPNTPNLYQLVVTLRKNGEIVDDYVTNIGLYNIQETAIEDRVTFIMNGQSMSMKAIDYIEDSEKNGATLNAAEYEKDIIALKTLGANVLRIRFGCPHPYLVSLCDKYGLLLLIDLPVRGVPESILGKDNYIVAAQSIIKDIIQAYENNPSVMAWGLVEEAAEGAPELIEYSQKIREVIRPLSAKLLYKTVRSKSPKLDIDGFNFIVFAMNSEDGQEFRTEAERLVAMNRKKPSVFSFSRLIQPDNHHGYSDPLSVEAQVRHIRQRFRLLQEYKISNNVIIGSFNDYATERPILITNNDAQYIATSGLVARNRDMRLPYQMVKALFNDEKEPVLEAGNQKPEIPSFYTIVSIALILIFFVLINTSRRFREDVIRSLVRPYNFYSDIRDQRILSNGGTLMLAVLLSTTLGLVISSIFYFLRCNYLLDYILTHLILSNGIKEFVNTIVWIPWASFAVATGAFLLVIGILTILIRVCSLVVKSRIFMGDAFVITAWAFLPIIFLLVMTLGLYRLLTTDTYTTISLLLIVYVMLWCLYRMFRGTAVIYDVRALNIYVIGILLLVAVLMSLIFYYDTTRSTIAFTHYFFSVLYR
jgi:Glycosyl hydrolases family 2/Glycosyl hydrolases family 2, sugar binding domain/Glycosyl hydrolases family 2, TIM barrel domain